MHHRVLIEPLKNTLEKLLLTHEIALLFSFVLS